MCIDTMDNVHITSTVLTVYKLVRISPERGVYYSFFNSKGIYKQKNHEHKILTYYLYKLIINYPGVYVFPKMMDAVGYYHTYNYIPDSVLLKGKIPPNTIIREGKDISTGYKILVTEKFIPTRIGW